MQRLSTSLTLVYGLLVASSVAQESATDPKPRNIVREEPLPTLFRPLSEESSPGNAGLFVGINDFAQDSTVQPLRFAVHDAVEQAYLFVRELQLIPPKNCYLAIAGTPDAVSVKQHLMELRQVGVNVITAEEGSLLRTLTIVTGIARQPSDFLAVSLSTHGFDEKRVAYVLPSDGMRKFLDQTALRLSVIEDQMETSKAGHRLLLVDACQERLSTEGRRGATSQPGRAMSAAFLESLKRSTGQAKFASCSIGEFSYEHPGLDGVGHGVFTFAFLQALRGGSLPDEQGVVRLDGVAKFVADRVAVWLAEQNRNEQDENRRKKQSPMLFAPIAAHQMPLAAKADDVLGLLAALRSRIDPAMGFDSDLCDQLITNIKSPGATNAKSQRLMMKARDFVTGKLEGDLFVLFLHRELKPSDSAPLASPPMPAATATGASPAAKLQPYTLNLATVQPGDLPMNWDAPENVGVQETTLGRSLKSSSHGTVTASLPSISLAGDFFLEYEIYMGGWGSQFELRLQGENGEKDLVVFTNHGGGNVPCFIQLNESTRIQMGTRFNSWNHSIRIERRQGNINLLVNGNLVQAGRIEKDSVYTSLRIRMTTGETHYAAEQGTGLMSIRWGAISAAKRDARTSK